jgi:hypothetical protein
MASALGAFGENLGTGYRNATGTHAQLFLLIWPMNLMNSGESEAVTCNAVTLALGRLKNGNKPGDPSKSPRCNARKRDGKPCRAPAMLSRDKSHYTRCRLHGGASTGPRTPEGLLRSQRARWKHGRFSVEYRQRRRETRAFIRWSSAAIRALRREFRAMKRALRRERAEPPEPPIIALSLPKT